MDEQTFEAEVNQETVHLARAALLFAREIAYPALDVDAYLAKLDQLAGEAAEVLDASPLATTHARARRLSEFIFQEAGFEGNVLEYSDPRNSFLNDVIDRRTGLPISLSVLFLSIAQRVGLTAHGVGMPGHFIVRMDDEVGDSLYLDPFYGGRPLTVEDCARLVNMSMGYSGNFNMAWLEPTPTLDILARMLNNLRNVYLQSEDWQPALAVLERLRILQPDVPSHLRDLGLLYYHHEAWRKAAEHLQRYLVLEPDAEDAEVLRANLQSAIQELSRLN